MTTISVNDASRAVVNQCSPTTLSLTAAQSSSRLLPAPLVIGAIITVGLITVALLAPQIAPYDMAVMSPGERLQSPSWQHPLGTDAFGRDLFSRILVGARISLTVAVASVLLAALPGILLGIIGGMRPGLLEGVLTRLMDAWIAVPSLLLAVVMAAALGRTVLVLTTALALSGVPTYYRQARAETLLVTNTLYVRAARSLGGTEAHLLLHHVLPNVMPNLLVLISLRIGAMLLAASALGFIGLGVQPPMPEWGALMAEGRNYVFQAWWLTLFPGLAIAIATFGLNLLGDGLRDLLDPRYGDCKS